MQRTVNMHDKTISKLNVVEDEVKKQSIINHQDKINNKLGQVKPNQFKFQKDSSNHHSIDQGSLLSFKKCLNHGIGQPQKQYSNQFLSSRNRSNLNSSVSSSQQMINRSAFTLLDKNSTNNSDCQEDSKTQSQKERFQRKRLKILMECLRLEQQYDGKESNNVVNSLGKIAFVYQDQGNYNKALEYYERILDIQTKTKGNELIDAAIALNNIGLVYSNKGDHVKALEYYEECLVVKIKVEGDNSINVAKVLDDIGSVYFDKRDYARALEYYEKCLAILKKIKGKYSSDVIEILNKFIQVYTKNGDNSKALEICDQKLEIVTKFKGKYTLDVADILNKIGQIYNEKEDYENGQKYIKKSKDIMAQIVKIAQMTSMSQ